MIKKYDCTNGGYQYCAGCYRMEQREYGEYVRTEDLLLVLKTAIEDCKDDPGTLWGCIEELIGELSDD